MATQTPSERDRSEPGVDTLGDELQPFEQQQLRTQYTSKGATLPGVPAGDTERPTTASDLAFQDEEAQPQELATLPELNVQTQLAPQQDLPQQQDGAKKECGLHAIPVTVVTAREPVSA